MLSKVLALPWSNFYKNKTFDLGLVDQALQYVSPDYFIIALVGAGQGILAVVCMYIVLRKLVHLRELHVIPIYHRLESLI